MMQCPEDLFAFKAFISLPEPTHAIVLLTDLPSPQSVVISADTAITRHPDAKQRFISDPCFVYPRATAARPYGGGIKTQASVSFPPGTGELKITVPRPKSLRTLEYMFFETVCSAGWAPLL